MKRILTILLVAIIALPNTTQADEGMWLPMFIKRLNYKDMKRMGLQLTPEEIYDVNNSSLKDAIVRLGGGFCTGEIISPEGLMLTNHHCGFGVIQENSTVEHDYLTDGFWAMKREEELPAGFSVFFLQRMDDVSDVINGKLDNSMDESTRKKTIRTVSDSIEKAIEESGEYIDASVKSFYKGNEFYVFTYLEYPDVRLVGAPPSSVGKFGGDTDNWMWPRHTGDFTMFRVYANENNEPSEYSEDNKAYNPKHFLPISLEGVKQDDFTMIFGYPGSTDRFLTSHGIELATEKDQPARVKIRREKLDLYEEGMAKSDAIRIQYASKYASVSNYWKYFIGQTAGLKRLKVYEKKQGIENDFSNWVNKDNSRKDKYGEVMGLYTDAYKVLNDVQLAETYLFEAVFGTEIIRFGIGYARLKGMMQGIESLESKKDKTEEENKELEGMKSGLKTTIDGLKAAAEDHFKDYNRDIDQNIFAAMFKFYNEDILTKFQPSDFVEIMSKYGTDYSKMADKVFSKSFLTNKEATIEFLNAPSVKGLSNDAGVILSDIFFQFYIGEINEMLKPGNDKKAKADRLFVAGLKEMNPNKSIADDANSTMRMTYGKVGDYYPKDAVHYDFVTTADGILEKEDPTSSEFKVPGKLKTLIQDKDYGQYANKDGELTVCFLSSNDITGGNSGSPVINAKGHLIGTAFDGNWEAMSGDIAFEPELQRTISVDIRYTLFIIDKYAGASHLIDEMKLVKSSKSITAPTSIQAPASLQAPEK